MTLLYKSETKSTVMHANKASHSGNPSVPFCFQEVEAAAAAHASRWLVTLRAAQKTPGGWSLVLRTALRASRMLLGAFPPLVTSRGNEAGNNRNSPANSAPTCSDLKSLEKFQREKFPPNQKKRNEHTSGCSRFVFKLVKKEKAKKKAPKLMRKSEERKTKGGQQLRNTALVVTCGTVSEDLPPR